MGSDIEHVKAGKVEQFPVAARNCFSGSLQRMTLLLGRQVEEAAIMEAGGGYLLQAGLDERSHPELVFGVESVILSGLTSLGYETQAVAIKPDEWREQLQGLLAEHAGVAIWVNSAHLDYADVYSSHPRFMHAVLVLEQSADLRWIKVFDSLVDERSRYSCVAWMTDTAFEGAILDRLRSKSLDHMGRLHTLVAVREYVADSRGLATMGLLRQAEAFRTNSCYFNAIHEYRLLCREAMASEGDVSRNVARRIFDHVNVLYVLPSLKLLEHSLCRAEAPEYVSDLCRTLMGDWRVLGLQSLKFESTSSISIAARMDERFERLGTATAYLWEALAMELGDRK
ncbi:hypothetical protein OG279_07580 [Streptomyces sp. NBC_01201]|uniref:hypothetical protein n=1 Tax=Streptomyces sp. NBC_01201 TaxID=2903770 RepID=UPI002E0DB6CD|nr:hypothetical protein OG279_07580 [Streptomyces sp. NBC_01201]